MRILEFEWDDGNALHIELGHGVTPSEAEEVFALCPLFKRTKKGHYAVFGPTAAGRYLVIIFQMAITGHRAPRKSFGSRCEAYSNC